MGRPKDPPYKNLKNIPPHLFKNRLLTDPVGDEFKEYLKFMLENHRDDLYYIFKSSQKYIQHGGAFATTFERWLGKLENNLKKDKK